MANTISTAVGRGSDSLIRCSHTGFEVNPLNGRELRRQAERNRKRAAKQTTTQKGCA